MEYEILKKGVCGFNASGRSPGDCSCEGPPRPVPGVSDSEARAERAYYEATQQNFFAPLNGQKWQDINSLDTFLVRYGATRTLPPPPRRRDLLGSAISELRPQLEAVSNLELVETELGATMTRFGPLREVTGRMYSVLNRAMRTSRARENATAVGKTMHILQPKLFLIWDNYVRTPRDYEDSFEGYWKYMTEARRGLVEALGNYRAISGAPEASASSVEVSFYQDGWKPLTKIYDEACYAMSSGYLHFC